MAKQQLTLLVDADIVAFEYSATGEVKVDWGDGEVQQYGVDTRVLESRIDNGLGKLKETLKGDELIICLTDVTNFRTAVLPTYKANRKGSLKPLHLAYAKEYMAKNYRSYIKPNLEADDVMGILATHPKLIQGKKIICSADKDMKTIPAWIYNPNKHKKPQLQSEHQAMLYHMEQTLTGDPVDGYSGCKGVGKVGAAKAIQAGLDAGTPWANHQQLTALVWKEVVGLYVAKGLTKEDALVQARVARICQWQDYDYKNNQVILWKEPTL